MRSDGIEDQKPQSNFKTPSVACEIVARRLLTVHKEGLTASVYTLPTHAHHRVTMATERE
ncbi:hypothetical protein PL11201_690011 [Planktothrix sp. PCC 11201]|nr:hypothetical protein PL11201_690011 [Planktothrix sp. PCC 11201]